MTSFAFYGIGRMRGNLLPNLVLALSVAYVKVAFGVVLRLAVYQRPVRFDFVVSAHHGLTIPPLFPDFDVFPDRHFAVRRALPPKQ